MLTRTHFEKNYKPQFSGHETFPLRYGWLKKAHDALRDFGDKPDNKSVFKSDDAIGQFGVGRNMVTAIRFWASATGVTKDVASDSQIHITEFGRMIFGDQGVDPYMEHPGTLWMVHWLLCSSKERTTWYWAFNEFNRVSFDRDSLVQGLLNLINRQEWKKVSPTTAKRDVECFLRCYAPKFGISKSLSEDSLESPLIELGLIKATGKKDGFRFVIGPKRSLPDSVFEYALACFIRSSAMGAESENAGHRSVSFESICHDPCSPGRVFKLDEDDVYDRINRIAAASPRFAWSESAGLRSLQQTTTFSLEEMILLVGSDINRHKIQE